MGIWDYISSAAETISGGLTRSVGAAFGKARAAAPDLSGALKNTRDLAKVASEATVGTSQAVVERMPDREGLKKIGRLGLRIADHALDKGTKTFTFGVPVYSILKEELSKNKSPEQPVKQKTVNSVSAELKATIQNLQKENMELQELRLRMESLEKKLVEVKQNGINQKGEKRRIVCSPLQAEASALLQAVNYAISEGFQQCTFYTDCMSLVEACAAHNPPMEVDWKAYQEIFEAWKKFKCNRGFICCHVGRSQNELADFLAKNGTATGESLIGFTFPILPNTPVD